MHLTPAAIRGIHQMTRKACVLFAVGGALSSAQAQPATYRLDPTHTSAAWEVLHMGTSTTRVRFDKLDATIQLDKAAKTLALGVTIDTTSLSSGHAAFDQILRSSQLFATAEFPTATFVATSVRFDGEALREVTGEMTLKGRNLGVVLKALRWRCGQNLLFKREVCGGDFEATVKRSEFGMTLALPLVADDIRIVIQVEAIKDDAP